MTTNTSARLGIISRRASTMYREMVQQDPAARGLASWHECMREAAREIKGQETMDRLTLADIAAALEDGESPAAARLIDALRHGAMSCPRWAQTRTRINEDGEKVMSPSTCAAWMGTREPWPESIDHLVNDAWTRLPAALDKAPERGKSAAYVIFLVCYNACQAIDREYNPNKRSKRTPEERAALELRMIGGRPADPEAAALAASLVDAAAPGAAAALAELTDDRRSYKAAVLGLLGRYSADAIAAALTAAGQTQGEIAALLGVPQCRISRALSRIRDRADAIMHG